MYKYWREGAAGCAAIGAVLTATGTLESVDRSHRPVPTATPIPAFRAEALGQLPMHFEVAAAAADGYAQYLSRGPGYAALLTATGTRLRLQQAPAIPQARPPQRAVAAATVPPMRVAEIEMRLLNANSRSNLSGQQALASTSNYFNGADPAQWRTDVAQFGGVQARQIYPGIDLSYYGTGQQLEYDFIVAAGADPGQIRYRLEGAQHIDLASNGDLQITVAGNVLIQHKPVVYQQQGNQRMPVEGHYRFDSSRNEVAFAIGEHDPGQALVIDPVLSYSSYLGGNQADTALAIAVDASGSVYVAGNTASPNFPTLNPLPSAGMGTDGDVFISKFTADGSALVYSSYLGGSEFDSATAIAVDSSGDVYLAGTTSSPDFPTKNPIQGFGGNSDSDAFVAKINPAGNALLYSTYLGGSASDLGTGIAIDSNGSAYVTGYSNSADFPTVKPIQTAAAGHYHAFVSKLSASGSALTYSTYLGGSVDDFGHAIAVDSSGNAYVVGYTYSSDFPTKNPIQGYPNDGNANAFVSKLNSSGSALTYSTYLGGNNYDSANAVVVDAAGNAYVAGASSSTNFPSVNSTRTAAGSSDAFITTVNAAGSAWINSSLLGGSLSDTATAIALDGKGSVYVAGVTSSTDFPTLNPTQAAGGNSDTDGFAAKLAPASTALVYATYLGGSGNDAANAIIVDSDGAAYVAGQTSSTDFPTLTPFQASSGGGTSDAFVTKIAALSSLQFVDAAQTAASAAQPVTVSVSRTLSSSGVATVNYATGNGTATAGTDYTSATGTLTWADGDTADKTFTVTLLNPSTPESAQTFTVTLSTPGANAELGTPATTTVTIPSHGEEGVLAFAATNYTVSEGAGNVELTVVRTKGTVGSISVTYATHNGTAIEGTNYAATTGTLTFADGQAAQTLLVPIIDDGVDDPSPAETFEVELLNPTSGASLGAAAVATVAITDIENHPGTIAFRLASQSVQEGAAIVTLAVSRTGGLTGPVSVAYTSISGSAANGVNAVSGVNYLPVSGVLTWDDNDATDKNIAVSIVPNAPVTPGENFQVQLSPPEAGTLGSPSTEVVTITANAATHSSGGAMSRGLLMLLALAGLTRRRRRRR